MAAVKQRQFTYAMCKISEIWTKISRAIHVQKYLELFMCRETSLLFRKREFCDGQFCGIKEL